MVKQEATAIRLPGYKQCMNIMENDAYCNFVFVLEFVNGRNSQQRQNFLSWIILFIYLIKKEEGDQEYRHWCLLHLMLYLTCIWWYVLETNLWMNRLKGKGKVTPLNRKKNYKSLQGAIWAFIAILSARLLTVLLQ